MHLFCCVLSIQVLVWARRCSWKRRRQNMINSRTDRPLPLNRATDECLENVFSYNEVMYWLFIKDSLNGPRRWGHYVPFLCTIKDRRGGPDAVDGSHHLCACLHLLMNNKLWSVVCSRHGSLIILFLIDQTHFLFSVPGTADICPPSKINCVDKALGKKQSSFISFLITIGSPQREMETQSVNMIFFFLPTIQIPGGRFDILKLLFLIVI